MEISGKIILVLPERGGVSQRDGREWKVASYIIETIEQYPRKCCFEVFGIDRINQLNIQVGQMLTVSLDIDAREYNGRWYNQIRAWKAVPYDPNAVATPAADPAAFANWSLVILLALPCDKFINKRHIINRSRCLWCFGV